MAQPLKHPQSESAGYTAAEDTAATMPEQLRIQWHNSTNPLNYKRLNRVNLLRRSEV